MVFSGMFISAVFWGTIADKYGRRPTLILTSVFLCYFGFLVSFRHHFTGMDHRCTPHVPLIKIFEKFSHNPK
jgi:MFS family permease